MPPEIKFSDNKMQPILDLMKEITTCYSNKCFTATVSLSFVLIDLMGSICMAPELVDTTKDQFIDWVDRYLKAAEGQEYQYRGIDIYAARCGLLHTYTAEAALHRKHGSIIIFSYDDGRKHRYNPTIDKSLAIIGIAALMHDLFGAVTSCLQELDKNVDRRKLAIQRMDSRYQTVALPQSGS